jgi:hypothetical protein
MFMIQQNASQRNMYRYTVEPLITDTLINEHLQ